jgi:hypothetical protein
LESAEVQRQEASKTEAQKLADKLAKLEAERDSALNERRKAIVNSAVTSAAARLQFRDPGDVLAMLDTSKLEVGEDGTIKELDEQLANLAKAKPYLLATSIIGGMVPTMPGHGQAQGETREQKRARIFGGATEGKLSGGYMPIKE